MKLQHLIIIFLIIMIPLVLVMSQYTSLQIDTLAKKTQYDTALLGATFDTMSAFELNTRNSESSSVIGEEIRDLEAIISTFTNSLSTSLGITGVGDDYIMSYVPAMVFSLYDGYYIYSINSETGERELKPYVYYTKTYTDGVNTNITISYSLDNYVSIYGTYDGKEISAAGYLIVPDDVTISGQFSYATTTKEDGSVNTYVMNPGRTSKITYKGIDIGEETIYENEPVAETRGVNIDEPETTTDAMMYYYEAKKFTELYNSVISKLSLTDQEKLMIIEGNDPEDENSPFMNEKIDVIKDSITQNLNTAIYNYDGAVAENYEMPQLNGEDWDKILNDISIIAFLKNIPIGTTTYNNYVVVNSTTNQKYVSAKSIDFIAYDKTTSKSLGYYHNITCDTLIDKIEEGHKVVGYAAPDFERYRYSPKESNEYYYYYKHNEYADYDCEVKAIKREGVATIDGTLLNKDGISTDTKDKVLKAYYTAVGRIRYRLVKASSYINVTDQTKSFTVKYNTLGGSFSDGTTERIVSSEYGKIRINQEEPRKLGHTFLGWTINPSETIPQIKTGDVLYGNKQNQEIRLYAVYAKQYIIEYNLNGGSGGPVPLVQTKIEDVDFIISKAQPTRENKVFLGWSTDPSATIPTFEPGDTYTGNSDLTLYAVWTDQVVKIEYISAGETYIDFKAIGASKVVWEPTPRDGHEFKGWTTIAESKVVEYGPGSQYSGNTDIKLYAVWDINTYTITLDANGGNFEGTSEYQKVYQKTYGVPFPIHDIAEKEGYTFKGWSTDSSASIADEGMQPGVGKYEDDRDITLYAVWEGDTYTIEYDGNADEVSDVPEKLAPILKNADATISTKQPVRTGYEFAGWSTDKYAEEEIEYASGATYTERTSIRLYAVWKRATYTIKYMANGTQFATQNKTYGVKVNIISSQPTREGIEFRGWSKTNGGSVDYYPNQVFKEDSLATDKIITLYAVWDNVDRNVYVLEYELNGGENGPEGEILSEGQATIKISGVTPTKTGYAFLGWSTEKTATSTDTRFAPNTECSTDSLKTYAQEGGTIILYAVWGPSDITLTVNPNGGTWKGNGNIQYISLKAGATMDLELPVRNGYVSIYWQIESGDASIENIYNEDKQIVRQKVTMGGENSTIIANWYARNYTLTYNANGGTGAPSKETRECDSTSALSSTKPTRTGYTFVGWATTSSATTAGYAAGANFKMPAQDTTLYAVWTANSYNFNYNRNTTDTVSNMPSSTSYKFGNSVTISSQRPTRTNYYFKKWTTQANGTGTAYQPGASFGTMPAYNVNLYAQWHEKIKVMFIIYGDKESIQGLGQNANSNEHKVVENMMNSIFEYEKTYAYSSVSSEAKRSAYGINYITDGNTAWLDGVIQNNQSKFDLFVLMAYGNTYKYPSTLRPTKPYLLYENIQYTNSAQTPIINGVKAKIDELMGT